MTTKIIFAKIRPTAKIPTKSLENAGYDIYADFEDDFILIPSHETVLVPTGVASSCSEDYCFIGKERGSTGSKGLGLRCGVIDSGYRGEIFIAITNTTSHYFAIVKEEIGMNKFRNAISNIEIYPYEKAIAQLLLIPVPKAEVIEISYEELKNIKSDRGTGKLGSSNK